MNQPLRFAATVIRLHRLAADVTGVLALPCNSSFRYRPGQYLSVLLGDGHRRSFSMASAYRHGAPIELHVRRRPGGRFSDAVLRDLEVGHRLELEGPFGQVEWREGAGPAVLMATGTGLAPVKALLEHALTAGGRRPIHLYWGGRTLPDLYLSAHFQELARGNPRLRFIPVLSRAHSGWAGRRGYVQDAVAQDLPDLGDAHIYACGSGVMIDAARARLAAIPGFDEGRFLADAFEPAVAVVRASGSASLSVRVNMGGAAKAILAGPGITLLSALRNANLPILSVCGGRASCGTCRINVAEAWRDRLTSPERTEQRLLANLDDTGPGDRLACQILLTHESDGLTISLGHAKAAQAG